MPNNAHDSSSVKNKTRLKILLIFDEQDITAVLKKGLEAHGFEVVAFNDPEEALAKYRVSQYDLLLLDIRMPKMSGFELYRKTRETDQKVKVCFLTAFEIYYDEFKRMFPKLHVRCFARKPVTASDLKKIIMDEMEAPPIPFK